MRVAPLLSSPLTQPPPAQGGGTRGETLPRILRVVASGLKGRNSLAKGEALAGPAPRLYPFLEPPGHQDRDILQA
jgi:hypothetical protein